MKVEIYKIDTSELEKYIIEHRESDSQFDEIEKREPLIKALVTDMYVYDVEDMFKGIMCEMKTEHNGF